MLQFSVRWLKERGLRPSSCRIIRVRGESMEPTLPDGSLILVDLATEHPKSGRISTVKGTCEAGDAVAVTVIGVASSRTASSLRCSVTSSPGGISCAWAVVGRASAPESASSAAAASPRAEPTSECRATRRRERPAGRPAADAACVQGEEPPPRRVRRRGRRSALGALGIVRQAGAPTPSLLLRCPDAAPAQRSGGLPQTRCVSSLHLPGAMLQPPACQAAAPSTFRDLSGEAIAAPLGSDDVNCTQ